MPRVFISYRRTDIDANVVGRLDDRMVERWGRKRVFRDIDSIPGGLDFAQHIQNTLSKRPVVLVLIGQTWLKVMNERLDDPQDFVRMEVASSLSEGLKVIPVLVGG